MLKKAITELKKGQDNKKGVVGLLKESTDGPLIAIVVEDFAATLGLVIALVGTILSSLTQNSIYDSISAISIGVLLMVSGLFLGYEMKHLITGESISQEKLKLIENIINKNENISKITDLKILPIGSKQYLALVKLDYKDSLGDIDIVEINTALKNEIVETESTITEIYFNPQ